MEKEKKTSESMLKAINKYNKDSINLAVSYKRLEREDGERVKAYLEQTGQSANSYIKALIKADLDSKGFNVDSAANITTDIDGNANTDSTNMP